MTDRPIIFNGTMVRAILDGRKTQTRRVLKLPKKTFSGGPIYERPDMGGWEPCVNGGGGCFKIVGGVRVPAPETVGIWHCTTGVCMDAPWQGGDRLWVRETWKPHSIYADRSPRDVPQSKVFYRADDAYAPSNTKWVSSSQMPRWASRLTLIVESVKVERLQDISEEDALAEGFPVTHDGKHYDPPPPSVDSWQGYGRASFFLYWSRHHGSAALAENPWVAAITFRAIHANIDSEAAKC